MQTVHKYIPTSNMYITKRIGNVAPLGMVKQNGFGGNYNRVTQNTPNEVSETDLYLLGAIEKLVYRVDYMENRVRKAEQLIYYLMQGNQNQNQQHNPILSQNQNQNHNQNNNQNQNLHKKEMEGNLNLFKIDDLSYY